MNDAHPKPRLKGKAGADPLDEGDAQAERPKPVLAAAAGKAAKGAGSAGSGEAAAPEWKSARTSKARANKAGAKAGPSKVAGHGKSKPSARPQPKPKSAPARSSSAVPSSSPVKQKKPPPAPAANPSPNPAMQPAPSPEPQPAVQAAVVPPPAGPARRRGRHVAVLASFLIWVLLPAAATAWYLYERAADQYASKVGFSVRKEEIGSAIELLGGITNLGGASSSKDTDILYEFIQSQKLVSDIDRDIDLRQIWSKPEGDPIFSFDPEAPIEDLVDYWNRMVRISYDQGAGLIEVEARAFDAGDATAIAEAVFIKSSEMINDLSAIAREDAIRYAREELTTAVERLKTAREAVTRFRNKHQLVDPELDLQSQTGLIGNLQGQLAEALIEVDLLSETARAGDPRLEQARRRVEVIKERIAAERRKLGIGEQSGSADVFADLVGEYERLVVDREFAERSYTAALASYDTALAEARRKSRYLAAYMKPTTAQSPEYPKRFLVLALVTLFLFLSWSIVTLVTYALKDRR